MSTCRVGRHQPQNIYRDDEYIAVAFSPADADLIVRTLNGPAHEPPAEFRDGEGDLWTRRSDGMYRLRGNRDQDAPGWELSSIINHYGAWQ